VGGFKLSKITGLCLDFRGFVGLLQKDGYSAAIKSGSLDLWLGFRIRHAGEIIHQEKQRH